MRVDVGLLVSRFTVQTTGLVVAMVKNIRLRRRRRRNACGYWSFGITVYSSDHCFSDNYGQED